MTRAARLDEIRKCSFLVSIRKRDLASATEDLKRAEDSLSEAIRKDQAACTHPQGFPGVFMGGFCPLCGLDDF